MNRLVLRRNSLLLHFSTKAVRKIEPTPVGEWPVLTLGRPPPTAIKLKPRSQSKLLNHIATLEDGTTVHLNPDAFEFKFTTLPSPSRKLRTTPQSEISQSHIDEIVSLRTENPDLWTVRKLASKYNVSPRLIPRLVPCPEHRLHALDSLKAAVFEQLPVKAQQARIDRQRRRLLW